MIRGMLDKRFIVNPQVSLVVSEYSKRRFTILGQVSRPGVYEYNGDEKLSVLQAVALAGGFTRLASSKVAIQRLENGRIKSYAIHPEAASKDPKAGPFQVHPDDTITVGSRVF
jgi:polysaccharide export outer membrane protein